MKKILLSTLVLGTMSSFAFAGEPAKLDATQLSAVAAGEYTQDGCGCSHAVVPAGRRLEAHLRRGVVTSAVAVNQGGPALPVADATAFVGVFNACWGHCRRPLMTDGTFPNIGSKAMKRAAFLALAVGLLTSTAQADPVKLADKAMDRVGGG